MNGTYSYHIFYFPFKWEIPQRRNMLFSKQVDLSKINVDTTFWERVRLSEKNEIISDYQISTEEKESLFAEQNYFFDFVHPALYDSEVRNHPLLMHFERKEPRGGDVKYVIATHGRKYVLKADAINLNLYATGVGILSLFLENEDKNQLSPDDVRQINQYGRRIMPPHYGEITDRNQLAETLSIIGLHGLADDYFEDFKSYRTIDSWKPARFITSLIRDLSPELEIRAVIDDRMFVNCTYLNEEFSQRIKNDPSFYIGDFWYRYVFVDKADETSCQNDDMKTNLLTACTYFRWQKYGSLYAVTRYSMMLLAGSDWFPRYVLSKHMRTMYSKMVELALVQQASMLRFSGEVTNVSRLSGSEEKMIEDKISSLYKEYIRFVNQIYFRAVSSQDQGIELYDVLLRQLNSDCQIKDLDEEISELHQYYSVLTDKKRNENSEYLNKVATICLPATILAGMFGMNFIGDGGLDHTFWIEVLIIIVLSCTSAFLLIKFILKK